ncbi:PMD domain-containing protein [Cephalotus follicularis]|uniref:PMD domain-containing protein n=1 Tax=Cephalotus follicularis TaxID=3775 RepID=A0A1Q3BNK6_CEPFO|nr:PMD domain-containing protein [Cephalotus follicularis]
MLSKQSITFNNGLMSSLLLFWNLTHILYSSLWLIGTTMEDVMSITNLSPTGVSCFDSKYHDFSSYPWDSSSTAYSHFMTYRRSALPFVSDVETISFYLDLICKFFVCHSFIHIQKIFLPMAYAFHYNIQAIALAPYFLGLVYRAINEVLDKSFSTTTSGPLWFVQLWAYAYFPVLAREPSVPFESIPNVSSYGDYLMSLTEASNDFETCFKYLSSPSIQTPAE